LMGSFPALVYVGVAILGIVAGDMMMGDPAMVRWLHPTAMLRSVAMMLEHAFDEEAAARELTQAVEVAIHEAPTTDLGGKAGTREFTDKVIEALSA